MKLLLAATAIALAFGVAEAVKSWNGQVAVQSQPITLASGR